MIQTKSSWQISNPVPTRDPQCAEEERTEKTALLMLPFSFSNKLPVKCRALRTLIIIKGSKTVFEGQRCFIPIPKLQGISRLRSRSFLVRHIPYPSDPTPTPDRSALDWPYVVSWKVLCISSFQRERSRSRIRSRKVSLAETESGVVLSSASRELGTNSFVPLKFSSKFNFESIAGYCVIICIISS